MPWTEEQRVERDLMRWFRELPVVQQALVSIYPRERGYTSIAPKRRVPTGRNVYCSVCGRGEGPVWFTNESGDKARRAAQLAAARHLRGHLRPAVGGSAGTAPD